jgi:hypothetical protein
MTNSPRDPGALSGALAGVSFAASLVALNALSEERYPMPGSEPAAIRRFFANERKATRLGAVAQLTCTACLARFAKSVAALAARDSSRLRAASVALTTRLSEREERADALYRLMFVTGGPVHGVGQGLLVGALGRAGLRTGELPPSLSKAALTSAAAGALSPLALVAKPAIVFVPLGRVPRYWSAALSGSASRGAQTDSELGATRSGSTATAARAPRGTAAPPKQSPADLAEPN